MLSLPLAALGLAAIGAYAKPTVRAVGGLEVSLSTPTDNVASVSDLRVIATVKNTGDEDVKIFKFETVLDNKHNTRPFIVSKDGKEVPFTGIEVLAHTDHASENDRIVIRAGEDVTAEHDAVSTLYDFSASGPGTFTFDPVSKFRVIGPSNATRIETANTRSISITIADASKRELEPKNLGQRIECADSNHYSFISISAAEARVIAMGAALYIQNKGDNQLYKRRFGRVPTDVVVSWFMEIANSHTADMVLSCSGLQKMCGGSPYFLDGKNIRLCDSFYDQQPLTKLCGNDPPPNGDGIRSAALLFPLGVLVNHITEVAN